ncbi:hypothetical protein [Streptomyces griseocarneus]|uniref:hypothetical protein n=1 Tax=Streptomyces griseocarneus TaxID=51201 RepID=UPI003D6CF90D
MTRPAPSRLRPGPEPPVCRLRTETEGGPPASVRPEPADRERESRPGTDRREEADREDDREDPRDDPDDPDDPDEPDAPDDDPAEGALPALPPLPALPAPLRGTAPSARPGDPVGGEEICPPGETTGASPHSPQYSSPPPTSS